MPRENQPFEQDFLLVTDTEMRVRQATQYTQLNPMIVPVPDEDVWEWETSSWDAEPIFDKSLDEEYPTIWESTLERL